MKEVSDLEDLLGEVDEEEGGKETSLFDFLGTDPRQVKKTKSTTGSAPSSPASSQPVIATGVLRYAIPAPRREGLEDKPDRGMSFMDILRTEPPESINARRKAQQAEEAAKKEESKDVKKDEPKRADSTKPAAPKPTAAPSTPTQPTKVASNASSPALNRPQGRATVVIIGASLGGCAVASRLNEDKEKVHLRLFCC